MLKKFCYLLLLMLPFATIVRSQECNLSMHNSIVRIVLSPTSSASGVVIAPDRVLTVLHGLPLNQQIEIHFESHEALATLIASHHGYDLALLQVPTGSTPVIEIATQKLQKGDFVTAVGFPGTNNRDVATGSVIKHGLTSLLSSASIEFGSSGGGLLVCNEGSLQLSGVLQSFVARLESGGLTNTGLSKSIPAYAIRQFLDDSQVDGFMLSGK